MKITQQVTQLNATIKQSGLSFKMQPTILLVNEKGEQGEQGETGVVTISVKEDEAVTFILSATDVNSVTKLPNAISITVNADSLDTIGDIAVLDVVTNGNISIQAGEGTLLIVNENYDTKTDGANSRIIIQKMSVTEYSLTGNLKPL